MAIQEMKDTVKMGYSWNRWMNKQFHPQIIILKHRNIELD